MSGYRASHYHWCECATCGINFISTNIEDADCGRHDK